jgi:hypothetical protein
LIVNTFSPSRNIRKEFAMKRLALCLAAIGVLGLAADQAFAQRMGSHSMAVQMTAGHGMHGSSYVGSVRHYGRGYGYGYRGHHGGYGYDPGCGPVYAHPYVPRHYGVGVPYYLNYRPYGSSYYRPHYGFSYRGSGLSIGIGF